jgi:twitching motility protein PilT
MIQTGRKFGMQLLDDHLWSLYTRGMIAAEEMIDKAKNPADLTDKVHKLGRTVGRIELDEAEDEKEAKKA